MTHLSLGATAAVVAVSLMATGDVLFATLLLAVAAADAAVGPAVVLAGVASLVRWGTPSLAGIGGDQAVLGIAGAVGPPLAAASAWCAAGALVLIPRRAPAAVIASGSLAALLVAGPTDAAGWWIRLVATVAAIAGAEVADRTIQRRLALAASLLLGIAAVALAVVA